ncbi:hypothetical protein PF005_g26256 [Phytophthora fragariae]|uniref:Uncharacterized protein n=1 Tax=Phytophthora fragariae TaxID=53985 RepID=A0A6A3R664_9STRA|nr:hypothetical protein PF003_g29901 [Phytophthora fragariae]KAE8922741.1 hypothetical protein PF009_g26998 [Phytophthora fragariae]KAE8973648.1 hypothetical protein PF011_g25167 [Phytophthora fragariae]KAE9069697.1 hypothetical protein PF010_g26563 [Phytophthora fragariae]KAE9072194.1 hypothetical protein PF007_g26268 [Phytophthora fragariae]
MASPTATATSMALTAARTTTTTATRSTAATIKSPSCCNPVARSSLLSTSVAPNNNSM